MANVFGGKGKGLYVPISEIEQEFISRLVENKDLYVVIHQWGHVNQPRVTFGDKNLHVGFKMVFDRPATPMSVYQFDMELKTRSGISLFRQKMSTEYGGRPLMVMQGLELDMVWDIAIKNIDPRLIKQLMPKTLGLTSRLQDKSTGEITLLGNMNLNLEGRRLAHDLNEREKALPAMEEKVRAEARAQAQKEGSDT